jgi:hypothetical protein
MKKWNYMLCYDDWLISNPTERHYLYSLINLNKNKLENVSKCLTKIMGSTLRGVKTARKTINLRSLLVNGTMCFTTMPLGTGVAGGKPIVSVGPQLMPVGRLIKGYNVTNQLVVGPVSETSEWDMRLVRELRQALDNEFDMSSTVPTGARPSVVAFTGTSGTVELFSDVKEWGVQMRLVGQCNWMSARKAVAVILIDSAYWFKECCNNGINPLFVQSQACRFDQKDTLCEANHWIIATEDTQATTTQIINWLENALVAEPAERVDPAVAGVGPIIQTVEGGVKQWVLCKCTKKHVVAAFIGTAGDVRVVVDVLNRMGDHVHALIATHHDHRKSIVHSISCNFLFCGMPTTSKDCAAKAAEVMNDPFAVFSGTRHYQKMYEEMYYIIRPAMDREAIWLTTFFTPMCNIMASQNVSSTVVFVDPFPSSGIEISGDEILTGLPVELAETGLPAKDKVMQALDWSIWSAKTGKKARTATRQNEKRILCMSTDLLDYMGAKILGHVHGCLSTPRMHYTVRDYDAEWTGRILVTMGSIKYDKRNTEVVRLLQLLLDDGFKPELSGKGAPTNYPSGTIYKEWLDYSSDLANYDLVIAHGGVGTWTDTLANGTNLVIWPIFGDQIMWAKAIAMSNIGQAGTVNSNAEDIASMVNKQLVGLLTGTAEATQRWEAGRAAGEFIRNGMDTTDDIAELADDRPMAQKFALQANVVLTNNIVNSRTDLPIGSFIVTAEGRSLVYTSVYSDKCVEHALEAAGALNYEGMAVDDNLVGATKDKLFAYAIVKRFNLAIIEENGIGKAVICETNTKLITILESIVGENKMIGHIVLIKAKLRVIKQERVAFSNIPVYSEDELDDNSISDISIRSMLEFPLTAEFRAPIEDKVALIKRMDVKRTRTSQRIDLTALALHKKGYRLWPQSNTLKHGDVILIESTDPNSQLCVVLKTSTDTFIRPLYDNTNKLNTMFVLTRMTAVDNAKARRPKTIKPTGWRWINAAAKQANQKSKFRNCDVWKGESDAWIILDCIDNRAHHMYDTKTAIGKAQRLMAPGWDSDNIIKLKELLLSDDRYIYYGKLLRYLTKSEELVRAYVSCATHLTGDYKVYAGDIYVPYKMWAAIDEDIKRRIRDVPVEERVVADFEEFRRFLDLDADQITEITGAGQLVFPATVKRTRMTGNEFLEVHITLSWSRVTKIGNKYYKAIPLSTFSVLTLGGNPEEEPAFGWNDKPQNSTPNTDWFGLRKKPQNKDQFIQRLDNVVGTAYNAQHDINAPGEQPSGKGDNNLYGDQHIPSFATEFIRADVEWAIRDPDMVAELLWTNNDIYDHMTAYAPLQGVVKSSEMPQRLITVEKTTLTPYPVLSRPIHNKIVYEEHKAVAGRLHSVQQVRKNTPRASDIYHDVVKGFFCEQWPTLQASMMENLLYYDPEATAEWINNHKSSDKVYEEVKEILAGRLMIKPFSDVNVHIKVESLLKEAEKVIKRWEQQQSRIIVWQGYFVAAIFSPIFTRAKQRLKAALSKRVIYADGHTPAELSAFLRSVKNVEYFYENDLTKQDRQTDQAILEVEFLIYEALGVHPDVMSVWRSIHDDWRYRGTFVQGRLQYMRMTGQATTALGNVITNMQVHSRFMIENDDKIKFVLLLGDDNLAGLSEPVSLNTLRRTIADNFNMQSKDNLYKDCGTFCQMIAYRAEHGGCELAPDYIRLRNRYEVTNGAHEVDDLNMTMRAMSYSMMLGDIHDVRRLVKEKQWPIKPLPWYDQVAATHAMQNKYEMSIEEVNSELTMLIQMMEANRTYQHKLTYYTSTVRKW